MMLRGGAPQKNYLMNDGEIAGARQKRYIVKDRDVAIIGTVVDGNVRVNSCCHQAASSPEPEPMASLSTSSALNLASTAATSSGSKDSSFFVFLALLHVS
jgi:hypothetical protein